MQVPMLEPKEIEIVPPGGGVARKYIISKFPAFEGREIVTQYPLTAIPKVGVYSENAAILLKMMYYVAVKTEGGDLRLTTIELINNHIPSWEMLAYIEKEIMQYNCSFFFEGRVSILLKSFAEKLPPLITSILTASLAQLSKAAKPPSTN